MLEATVACVPPPRMCGSEVDCGAQASCVAGRCVVRGATAAIDTGRRLLFFPADLAFLAPSAPHAPATVGVLGSTRQAGAVILLRFDVPLLPEASVLEAYLVLERAAEVDPDPRPLVLHTVRIVDPWDSRTLSWALQPRTQDAGAPVTPLSPASGSLVRLDVRALVQRWRRRRGDDFGVAVRAEGSTDTGVAFALAPTPEGWFDPVVAPAATPSAPPVSPFDPHPALAGSVAEPRRQRSGPRLELYVR